jgi:hypothetical protein
MGASYSVKHDSRGWPGHARGSGFNGGETVAVKPLLPPLLTLREGMNVLFA